MILVTGGAGFIGSVLQQALAEAGHETIVVDWLGATAKWRNLARHPPAEIIAPEALDGFLESGPPVEMVFHLGAISETTATDADLVWATNVSLPQRLWRWCAAHGVRLIYASSAATYGDGAAGFDDDPAALASLRPLNLYGWSKHSFDRWVAAQCAAGARRPPQWAGLKFFNVYGPNEYHKAKMVSVVKVKHDDIVAGHKPRLFRADRADVADGEQKRDFVHVNDAVRIMLWLLTHPSVSGLYNVGTGQARSYRDLAFAVCRAAGVAPEIAFIDMPASLRGQYQSFTQADLSRLRAAGYDAPFTSLEDGVSDYVRTYLRGPDPYL